MSDNRVLELQKQIEAEKAREEKLKRLEDDARQLEQLTARADEIRMGAARVRAENEVKDKARAAYLVAGGSLQEFNDDWPAIRREILRERAMGTVQPKRLHRTTL